jgi:hypothetical protein
MSAEEACARVCVACVALLGVDGAGIIVVGEGGHVATMAVSDAFVRRLEDLQFVLGEGPGLEATATGRSVRVPDLVVEAGSRWSAYAPAAADEGVGAVFAFPMQLAGVRLGALDLYRRHAGLLDGTQTTRAVELAELAVAMLSRRLGVSPTASARTPPVDGFRFGVHQAAGMISEQLDVSVDEALARLRAYAYAAEQPVDDVAREVIARRLRIDQPPE